MIELSKFNLEVSVREDEGIAGTTSIGMEEKLGIPQFDRARLSTLVHPELFLDHRKPSEVQMFRCRGTQVIGALDGINAVQE